MGAWFISPRGSVLHKQPELLAVKYTRAGFVKIRLIDCSVYEQHNESPLIYSNTQRSYSKQAGDCYSQQLHLQFDQLTFRP